VTDERETAEYAESAEEIKRTGVWEFGAAMHPCEHFEFVKFIASLYESSWTARRAERPPRNRSGLAAFVFGAHPLLNGSSSFFVHKGHITKVTWTVTGWVSEKLFTSVYIVELPEGEVVLLTVQ
jgi:hypothetical protein